MACFDRMVMNCLGIMYTEEMNSTGADIDDDDENDENGKVTESME